MTRASMPAAQRLDDGGDEAGAAVTRSLELDPAMTIARLKAIYPVSGYRNLDGFLDGLRKAGVPG